MNAPFVPAVTGPIYRQCVRDILAANFAENEAVIVKDYLLNDDFCAGQPEDERKRAAKKLAQQAVKALMK